MRSGARCWLCRPRRVDTAAPRPTLLKQIARPNLTLHGHPGTRRGRLGPWLGPGEERPRPIGEPAGPVAIDRLDGTRDGRLHGRGERRRNGLGMIVELRKPAGAFGP